MLLVSIFIALVTDIPPVSAAAVFAETTENIYSLTQPNPESSLNVTLLSKRGSIFVSEDTSSGVVTAV